MNLSERFQGCLLGLAVGDAVGTTVEFKPRGSFKPVTDMLGGGPFNLKPGQWTDDTSMALCLGYSLLECGGFNALDQMQRYLKWLREGYCSSTGRCFDIGNTVSKALRMFEVSGNPFSGSSDPYSAGNGSLMRLAPVILYYYPDQKLMLEFASESSRTTHAESSCLDACRLYAAILGQALDGANKQDVLIKHAIQIESTSIQAIANGDYMSKSRDQIRGTGYVVESLEAALWSFYTTDSFESAILTAVNLGDDADTTAAICGQIAGAYYGINCIPQRWLNRLAMRNEISNLAERLLRL